MLAFCAIDGYSGRPSPVNVCFFKSGNNKGFGGFGVLGSEYTDKSFSEYIMKCF